MTDAKVPVTYNGVHDAVEVELDGQWVVVEQEEAIHVSETNARRLLDQEANWGPGDERAQEIADELAAARRAAVQAGVPDAPVTADQPPFEGYDELSAKDVIERLKSASDEEFAAVQAYEATHQARKTIANVVREPTPPPPVEETHAPEHPDATQPEE